MRRAQASATTLPSRMTIARSAMARTSFSLCEMNTTAPPAATKRRICASSAAARCPSSELVGSSSTTIAGGAPLWLNARAISTAWRAPSGRSPTIRPGGRCRPGNTVSIASVITAAQRRRQPKPVMSRCMMRAFSAMLKLGHSDPSWNTKRIDGCRAPNATVAPSTRMSPASGLTVPASTFISVDLPAPLWPTTARHSPAFNTRSTPRKARTAPKLLRMPERPTASVRIVSSSAWR